MTEQRTWKMGDIIRHRTTGKPFIVVQLVRPVGTIIADLEERHPLARMLFSRDYEDFAKDKDMQIIKHTERSTTWKFDPISL